MICVRDKSTTLSQSLRNGIGLKAPGLVRRQILFQCYAHSSSWVQQRMNYKHRCSTSKKLLNDRMSPFYASRQEQKKPINLKTNIVLWKQPINKVSDLNVNDSAQLLDSIQQHITFLYRLLHNETTIQSSTVPMQQSASINQAALSCFQSLNIAVC